MTPRLLPQFCGDLRPTAAQAAFLCYEGLEALYGGAAFGGKSFALCFAANQFVDDPAYRALLLRPRLSDFSRTDAIQATLEKMNRGSGAVYNVENFTWTYPSKAKVQLAYLKKLADVGSLQGGGWHFIGFDELALYEEAIYNWAFGRARGASTPHIPIRIRSTCNPPETPEGQWVTERFITHREPGAVFIPASLDDNPHADPSTIATWEAIKRKDPVLYQRQRRGNFFVNVSGSVFKAEHFPVTANVPTSFDVLCRGYDLAGTDKDERDKAGRRAGERADYTVGTLAGWTKKTGLHHVLDCQHGQWSVSEVDRRMIQTAERDGKSVLIAIEQQPGAAGKQQIAHFKALLPGYHIIPIPARHGKVARTVELQRYSQDGLVALACGPVNAAWLLDQIIGFPSARHDDGVDSLVTAIAGIHARKIIERELI